MPNNSGSDRTVALQASHHDGQDGDSVRVAEEDGVDGGGALVQGKAADDGDAQEAQRPVHLCTKQSSLLATSRHESTRVTRSQMALQAGPTLHLHCRQHFLTG